MNCAKIGETGRGSSLANYNKKASNLCFLQNIYYVGYPNNYILQLPFVLFCFFVFIILAYTWKVALLYSPQKELTTPTSVQCTNTAGI